MDVLAKQVNDLLKNQYELGFQYDEEKAEFYFSIDMNHVCLDVRIICREADKQVLMFAYVPIKIQESQYSAVLRLINKIQMDNFDSVSLFINENCNQLMSQSALNVGADFRIDEEVFRFAFYPLRWMIILSNLYESFRPETKNKFRILTYQNFSLCRNKMIRKHNIGWQLSTTRERGLSKILGRR